MLEFEAIDRIRQILGTEAPGVTLGIGDDAAVLVPTSGESLVWTIDAQVEGVHFRPDLLSWRDIGFRSMMAAASDIAAMGALPWVALCAWTLPGGESEERVDSIASGQRDALALLRATMVGGNISRAPEVTLTTTLLGRATKPIARGGAKPGHGLFLAGRVGWAAAGFRALEEGRGALPLASELVAAWRTPRALVADGLAMQGRASAAIDVSDGLAADVAHLARASSVMAVLDTELLLGSCDGVKLASLVGRDALHFVLHGGEDYALVAASAVPIPGFVRIGELREGEGVLLRTDGGETRIDPSGFDHFTGRG